MNAHDVIDSYVTDVAVRLPRRQRNDVAFELRALLDEELQDRAASAGRAPDADMAIGLVRGFGRPAEAAARYRPTVTIIDPVDGRAFLWTTVIGLAVIWGAGLLGQLQQPAASAEAFWLGLGRWWGAALPGALWWPGALVLGFGLAAWARRRQPQRAEWTPRAPDRIQGSRVAMAFGMVGIVCGVAVLLDPTWMLDVLWHGRAAPAAYAALTYTPEFLHRQAPVLLGLILLNLPLFAAVMVRGRWSPLLRRLELGLGLLTCAAMIWTVLDGPAFMTQASDSAFKGLVVLVALYSLVHMAVVAYRSVRPTPQVGVRHS
ncbi:hypothetical protein [Pseudoxanthomonas sp.]|uniref:hypothetical protein n=1 Tax=Pseudoxanthomonas sp. TaxID=1871049 RepID=UPI00260B7C8E|nr:hypothetical protein [Pseudoxanthomonas sp.]WDS34955.1 MAG: hypothetical protein O8I58_11260 [Pseudoxanthomonas sp.]